MTVHKLDLYPTQSQTDLNPLPIRKNSWIWRVGSPRVAVSCRSELEKRHLAKTS